MHLLEGYIRFLNHQYPVVLSSLLSLFQKFFLEVHLVWPTYRPYQGPCNYVFRAVEVTERYSTAEYRILISISLPNAFRWSQVSVVKSYDSKCV